MEDTSADTDTDTDSDTDTDTDTDTSPPVDADQDTYDADEDCDDTDPAVNPGAVEVCDGVDNDCDGDVDGGAVDAPTWYLDADADGFGDDTSAVVDCAAPGADYVDVGGDCDDGDVAVHPGAEEADCEDPVDYNCDGSTGLDDADADGAIACEDCDDTDATSHPDAPELEDGADNDCDSVVDEGTNAYDDDLDGFTENAGDCDDANAGASPDGVESCDGADNDCDAVVDDGTTCFDDDHDGVTEDDGDCDDASDVTYPGASEAVDGLDNDCNGLVDDGTDVYDDDGDAYTEDEGDCDDANADVSPAAVETCDGEDDDCDGDTDEADAVDASTWWEDPDADGYGDVGASIVACDQPSGYVLDNTDCSGGLSWINPGEVEVCDDYDNDCDGDTDEADAADASTWWEDPDADGYGDVGASIVACDQPAGYVLDNTDCSGGLSWINPGELEVCDDFDNDCDGDTDESDAADASTWWVDGDNDGCDGDTDESDAVDATTWYTDGDGDGYGDALIGSSCAEPASASDVGGDCDDGDVAVSPGMAESCDAANVDEDCDGLADDLDPEGASGMTDWWPDTDGDSWGVPFGGTTLCDQPAGYGPNLADCDDGDAAINPDATEVWYDGVDQDCDYASGRADYDADGDSVVDTLSLADADGVIEGSGNTGNEVHYIGDTNGDGFDDIYVAAPSTYNGSVANAGMGYLFQGPVTGDLLVSDADATFQGQTDAEGFGTSGAYIGDIDGDGVDDVMVAATNYEGGYTDNGGAFFFPGGVTGAQTSATAYTTLTGPAIDSAHFGVVAGGMEVVDSDGSTDGNPEVLARAGQVLVKVIAGSVNPVDWKRASGAYRLVMPVTFPAVPGFDIAGVVESVGPGVTAFSPGDRVHARIAEGSGGGAAEYAVSGVTEVARMAEGLDFAEAAAMPLAGMTALQALRDLGGLVMQGSTQRVLVVGASGGVGHLGLQVARATGATTIGVCSAKNAALVLGLGASAVIDYAKPDCYNGQAPFDIVLDCVGSDPGPFMGLLGPAGVYVSCLPAPGNMLRALLNPFTGKKVRAVMLKTNAVDLALLDALYAAGKLKAVIDSRFPLEQLPAAWERSMSGRSVGKIVVDVG